MDDVDEGGNEGNDEGEEENMDGGDEGGDGGNDEGKDEEEEEDDSELPHHTFNASCSFGNSFWSSLFLAQSLSISGKIKAIRFGGIIDGLDSSEDYSLTIYGSNDCCGINFG